MDRPVPAAVDFTKINLQEGIPDCSQSLELFRKDGSLKSLDEIEVEVIRFHVMHNRDNMSETACTLGISRSSLYRKVGRMTEETDPRLHIG